MPTTGIAAGGGEDYTTISAWESNETAAGSIGEIRDSSTYDELITISGGGGGRKLTVSSANRHSLDKTGAVVNPSSTGHIFTVSEDDFTVEYLRLTDPAGSSSEGFRVNNTGFTAKWCMFHDFDASAEQDGIYTSTSSIAITAIACIFQNITRGGVLMQSIVSNVDFTIENCTAVNTGLNTTVTVGAYGADAVNGPYTNCTLTSYNSVGDTSSGDAFEDGGGDLTMAGDYNAATDLTSPGANSIDSITLADEFEAVSAGSEDLHLKAGSNLIGAGTARTGVLTADAEGDTYDTGAWDVGADAQAAAGGGLPIPVAMHHYQLLRNR